ncbi:hypothetical protein [Clostridium sp. YIM B02551]|uniref:hypothetical protein n=1 Tax=Clostridium sp. YIM B02551 TaxID=2910679 RepID=UPI001EEAD8B6|nr:hypothetical protein [Clostridium sp. YIM B02551]
MNENCKNCMQVENLKNDVDRLRNDVKDIYERLREVESFSASGGEQIKMIFKILEEIKDSIKDIGSKIGENEKKPGEEYSKVKMIIITAIISTLTSGIGGAILASILIKK